VFECETLTDGRRQTPVYGCKAIDLVFVRHFILVFIHQWLMCFSCVFLIFHVFLFYLSINYKFYLVNNTHTLTKRERGERLLSGAFDSFEHIYSPIGQRQTKKYRYIQRATN